MAGDILAPRTSPCQGPARSRMRRRDGERSATFLRAASRRPGPGRPPRLYAYAAAGNVIAIDLGVNTVSVHLSDLRGELRCATSRHLYDPGEVDRTELLNELVDEALAAAKTDPAQVHAVA